MMGTIEIDDLLIIEVDENGDIWWIEPENTGWTK